MATYPSAVGLVAWWWTILGSVFLILEWEYAEGDSFLDHVSRRTITEYGRRAGLIIDIGTGLGGIAVWPVVAYRRLPDRFRHPSWFRPRRTADTPDVATSSADEVTAEADRAASQDPE